MNEHIERRRIARITRATDIARTAFVENGTTDPEELEVRVRHFLSWLETANHLHGDIGLRPIVAVVPTTKAERVATGYTRAKRVVLQESVTTGNRHVLQSKFLMCRWNDHQLDLIHSGAPFELIHEGPHAEHGTHIVPAGTWQVQREEEYDLEHQQLRPITD